MRLHELIDILENPDRLRIIKDGKELYIGYLALFAPVLGNRNYSIYEKHKNDRIVKFEAVPEIKHRKWKELKLMSPMQPDETPDFRFSDLQMKLYYTIYL